MEELDVFYRQAPRLHAVGVLLSGDAAVKVEVFEPDVSHCAFFNSPSRLSPVISWSCYK